MHPNSIRYVKGEVFVSGLSRVRQIESLIKLLSLLIKVMDRLDLFLLTAKESLHSFCTLPHLSKQWNVSCEILDAKRDLSIEISSLSDWIDLFEGWRTVDGNDVLNVIQ